MRSRCSCPYTKQSQVEQRHCPHLQLFYLTESIRLPNQDPLQLRTKERCCLPTVEDKVKEKEANRMISLRNTPKYTSQNDPLHLKTRLMVRCGKLS
ncbi:hypothetical protein PROFUN_04029 [Planoprotostelium fungivorum]|uniref:Uncharacterized protein n=1 Tax=Planoprotostelium fungivorum TaxID=1890364 RepID=A0A2P6NW95_9EUKA|nr:hypothetical protein PROFUN_04029 [Planoprotostelium fungivorum]